MRTKLTDYNKQLADAAHAVGVPGSGFAVFQDHGYMGLYGGEQARGIAARKGLKKVKLFSIGRFPTIWPQICSALA